ncbi:MAG: glycoside hydrolase family 16 protein [Niabella sp.]
MKKNKTRNIKNTGIRALLFVSCVAFMTVSCEKTNSGVVEEKVDYWRPKAVEWVLDFEDNFDGNKVNEDNWSMYDGPGHGNNGWRRPGAFSVADGLLTITAQMINGDIVSGGMAHKKGYKYGKFEARVRADDDPSLATNAVFLTWPDSEKWPIDGENNIWETTTNRRDKFYTFVHYGADNKQYQKMHNISAKEWHVVAMEWEPYRLRILVDDKLQWTLTDSLAIPHNSHHACLQLDAFAKTMGDPVKMYVDWIKVYRMVEKD